MKEAYFEFQFPRDNLYLSIFSHKIMNYRYHWHPTDYELNILLSGTQEYFLDTKAYTLSENDVILLPPGIGHASHSWDGSACSLVIHFSKTAFKPYVKKGYMLDFPKCRSSKEIQQEPGFSRLRFYAAQIMLAAQSGETYSQLEIKASMELLISTLGSMFSPQVIKAPDEEAERHQETVKKLLSYIEAHYREKLTLEELAESVQYNRTYLSTLFRNTVGVNFYEYLMRVRFQKALSELAETNKNLTDIALDNGFSDLKSFNARFRSVLHCMPSEYRAKLNPAYIMPAEQRNFISWEEPHLKNKLLEYAHLG